MYDEAQPFDANKIRLSEDRSGPREDWRLTSLIKEIQDALLSRFTARHREARESFEKAVEELVRRGLDAESIVRYGMLGEIVAPLMGVLLIGYILPKSDITEEVAKSGVDIEGWRSLLRIPHEATIGDEIFDLVQSAAESVAPPLINWAGQVSLNSLMNLELPARRDFWSPTAPPPVDARITAQYRWLVERLTETYLQSWNKSSLLLEYRYRKNLQPMSFPVWVMDEREVPFPDLTDEIARRTALNWDPAVPEVRTEFIVAEMTNRARDLLAAGRTAEASALFEFAVHQWPADARARNNLGFCLIPLDPARALTHLNTAARDRYAPLAVNVYNRMCCHMSLRQPRAVLDLAEQWWNSRDPSEDDVIAILWTHSPGGWQLDISATVKGAITALAIATACVQGWQEDEQVWRERASGDLYPSQ